jgi:hypothetical protein
MTFLSNRTEPLSAEELYLFDTMGFVRIPGFLAREVVEECRSEVMRLPSRPMGKAGDKERFDDLVSRSSSFGELARSEAVLGLVAPLINQPLRLIESYALRRVRVSDFHLHNGNSEILQYGGNRSVQRNMSLHHTFHDGKLFCMFVKVLVYVNDVRAPDDGPFCYLQGSHKANLPWFRQPTPIEERPALTKQNFPSLEHVLVDAGDVILLNEALLHGTLPKRSSRERLLLAFSYAPAFVGDWKKIDKDSSDIAKLGHY